MATAAFPTPASAPRPPISATQALTYLTQFIGRNLRIHVTDSRMFIGQMKCTDKVPPPLPSPPTPLPTSANPRNQDRNVILSLTHEYRPPSPAAIRAAIRASGDPTVQLPLSSRYVGLVVVPGRYITKIECEETPWAPAPVMPPPV
ncbi:Lsm domain-containing protein [Neofusicoccum parvum]|uniref:Lsm domain-containing protein n=1 Tax=Neofusicoccum parvum TaxID=310453 RepID=A0ACB5S710_9PEZI|nr:Lsm domain-containing protein [Neofusicoccum parvum]